MSPEHISGEDLDGRSDIYSLGCVLYEMLTGRLTCSAKPGEVHLELQIPSTVLDPSVAAKLNQVVGSCLSTNRADRYSTAEALRDDLQQALHRFGAQVAGELPEGLPVAALVNEGKALVFLGEEVDGIRRCDEAISLITGDSGAAYDPIVRRNMVIAALTNKGIGLRNLGRFDDAIDCWNKAIEVDPDHKNAKLCKANALAENGHLEEAVRLYREILNKAPDDYGALANLGLTLCTMNRKEEALDCVETALKLCPGIAAHWNTKAKILAEMGRINEALMCLDEALRLDPLFGLAWYSKGVCYLRRRDYMSALKCFTTAKNNGYHAADEGIAQCRWEWLKAIART